MNLEDLGFKEYLERSGYDLIRDSFETGRIIAAHKDRYTVRTSVADLESEITGNMRFTARNREDFPCVGDWVALTVYSDMAIIHGIYPRYSLIKRQSVDREGEVQPIAANVDCALLIQAAVRDFNMNRLERYLTICNASNVNPLIVLSKTDLIDPQQINEIMVILKRRIREVPIIAVSNQTQAGYDKLNKMLRKGMTYCMLGSSGVGKSTLLNNLTGMAGMKTGKISQSTNKGRHVTSHRELVILVNGALLIDNPGMREVGIADSGSGLKTTFDQIVTLSDNCRFKDCTHTHEAGCAVIEAVRKGELDNESYGNYLKIRKEKEHFETSVTERRRKEKKFGKILKSYKKDIKKNQ